MTDPATLSAIRAQAERPQPVSPWSGEAGNPATVLIDGRYHAAIVLLAWQHGVKVAYRVDGARLVGVFHPSTLRLMGAGDAGPLLVLPTPATGQWVSVDGGAIEIQKGSAA